MDLPLKVYHLSPLKINRAHTRKTNRACSCPRNEELIPNSERTGVYSTIRMIIFSARRECIRRLQVTLEGMGLWPGVLTKA